MLKPTAVLRVQERRLRYFSWPVGRARATTALDPRHLQYSRRRRDPRFGAGAVAGSRAIVSLPDDGSARQATVTIAFPPGLSTGQELTVALEV